MSISWLGASWMLEPPLQGSDVLQALGLCSSPWGHSKVQTGPSPCATCVAYRTAVRSSAAPAPLSSAWGTNCKDFFLRKRMSFTPPQKIFSKFFP